MAYFLLGSLAVDANPCVYSIKARMANRLVNHKGFAPVHTALGITAGINNRLCSLLFPFCKSRLGFMAAIYFSFLDFALAVNFKVPASNIGLRMSWVKWLRPLQPICSCISSLERATPSKKIISSRRRHQSK